MSPTEKEEDDPPVPSVRFNFKFGKTNYMSTVVRMRIAIFVEEVRGGAIEIRAVRSTEPVRENFLLFTTIKVSQIKPDCRVHPTLYIALSTRTFLDLYQPST